MGDHPQPQSVRKGEKQGEAGTQGNKASCKVKCQCRALSGFPVRGLSSCLVRCATELQAGQEGKGIEACMFPETRTDGYSIDGLSPGPAPLCPLTPPLSPSAGESRLCPAALPPTWPPAWLMTQVTLGGNLLNTWRMMQFQMETR